MIGRRDVLLAGVGAGLTLAAPRFALGGEAKDQDLWRYVATSRFVVAGTMRPPPGLFDRRDGYWEIPVEDATALKGTPPTPLTLRHWSVYSGSVDNEGVPGLANKPAILFLILGDDGRSYLVALDGLVTATPANLQAVKTEIALQKAQIAAWRPNRRRPHAAEVRQLIDRVAGLKRSSGDDKRAMDIQADAFATLEALGMAAVPAIIDQMDDRRPLAFSQISLRNKSPDAFEGMRHYGPDVMVEALAAILGQVTGESFGFIYNGATEAERANTVDAWRVYLARQKSKSRRIAPAALASSRQQ